jgi:hypothetical protein
MNDDTARFEPPFVGRQALLAEVHQMLNASSPFAPCITSFEGMGKSSFLRRLETLDERWIVALVPLVPYNTASESVFLETLSSAMHAALLRAHVNPALLPSPDGTAELREWLQTRFLPEASRWTRQRRLIWLLDDVQYAAEAISAGHLPADLPTFLHHLLGQFSNLGILTSLDLDSDARIDLLLPLVNPEHMHRLGRLSPEDTALLLDAVLEYVPQPLAQRVYQESGGIPRLLNDLCESLRQYAPLDDAVDIAYEKNLLSFRQQWDRLSRDERITLTALTHLHYEDPTRAPSVQHVEQWLVQTDYPMDTITIHAQLRALEYRDILRSAGGQILFVSGLFQRWLFEHARLEEGERTPPWPRWAWLGALAAAALFVVVSLIVSSLPAAGPALNVVPTITLDSAP